MHVRTIVVLLAAILCLVGCTKKNSSSTKPQRLVPMTGAEVMASPDFRLEHTTKSGLQFYVRDLPPELTKSISGEDQEFVNGDEPSQFFLVMIRDGKIMDTAAASAGGLKLEDAGEVLSFTTKRNKSMQETLKAATNK